jgi:hypothetical protein
MIALARQLGLPAETVREAGLAGLLQRAPVVPEQNPKALLAPRVKVFFSAKSRLPLPQVAADLSKPGIEDRIVGRESAAAWGFEHLDELWSGIPQSRARR